jgi:HPt (histidine-containing phosphotransfer) domain-containing protein
METGLAKPLLENATNKIAKLREGVIRANASAVEKAAHTLKDSAGYFGRKHPREAAYRSELMAND